jgi:hypothetical protein
MLGSRQAQKRFLSQDGQVQGDVPETGEGGVVGDQAQLQQALAAPRQGLEAVSPDIGSE